MALSDIASALDRVAPRAGATIKFTFTSSASTAQELTFHSPGTLGGFAIGQGALYVSIKTTIACHVVFGGSGVANPANTDFLLEPTDGLQDFVLLPDMTHFKVKGDSAGGDLYVTVSGH